MPANFSVLLVEDDSNDAALIARAFEKASLPQTVRAVESCDEATAYLSGQGPFADRTRFPMPALVLLDLKLVGRSGFDLLAWIRQRPELQRLPAVVLTSSKEKSDIARAYELGATSYMVKPVGFDELLAMVKVIGAYWLLFNRHPEFPVQS